MSPAVRLLRSLAFMLFVVTLVPAASVSAASRSAARMYCSCAPPEGRPSIAERTAITRPNVAPEAQLGREATVRVSPRFLRRGSSGLLRSPAMLRQWMPRRGGRPTLACSLGSAQACSFRSPGMRPDAPDVETQDASSHVLGCARQPAWRVLMSIVAPRTRGAASRTSKPSRYESGFRRSSSRLENCLGQNRHRQRDRVLSSCRIVDNPVRTSLM